MLNEWTEFLKYTGPVRYAAASKSDTTYMGRFTFKSFLEMEGFARVFTVIARGYLFHERDGSLTENPRERIGYARRALCAWCSIPPAKKAAPQKEWQFKCGFPELHGEFPELVDAEGNGWLVRHVHGIIAFVEANPGRVSKTAPAKCEKLKSGFDKKWRKKVLQYQISLFAPSTLGDWPLLFDDALAVALELGPLRQTEVELSPALLEGIKAIAPKKALADEMALLAAYYTANKPENSDWVVLHVSNFDAYLGSSTFGKKHLAEIPSAFMERSEPAYGVSRYRIMPEYLALQEEGVY